MIEGRKKFIIFVGIAILFIIAMILLALFLRKNTGTEPTDDGRPQFATTTEEIPVEEPQIFVPKDTPAAPPATTEEREKLYVKQLARTFVERFETYSNQNDNRNIEDATELATANMAGYIETKTQPQNREYQGVTTKVISMEVTAFDGTNATVKVGAQVETQTQTTKNTSYKNGRVELLKVDGVWKVNGVYWDPT